MQVLLEAVFVLLALVVHQPGGCALHRCACCGYKSCFHHTTMTATITSDVAIGLQLRAVDVVVVFDVP